MRYLPHTAEDITAMLEAVGVKDLEDLFRMVPEEVRRTGALDLPEGLPELELSRLMGGMSERMACGCQVYVGAGSYEHFIPASIQYLLGRSEFSTAYTPYQPEISQGTLQGIFEYQTLVSRLLGLETANASMYDGASALAEALLMALRIAKKKTRIAVSKLIHPMHRRVVQTYFEPTGYEIIELDIGKDGKTDFSGLDGIDGLGAVAVQSPNFFGIIEDLEYASGKAHDLGALMVASFTEPLAFGLLKSPGSQGADIACGEGQSFGIPASFGGPGLGMMATKMEFVRNLPGRLAGQTVDLDGRRGFVLTLATREQHIRREKAVSNICTNSNLCALTTAMYMASLGSSGLRELAALNYDKSEYLKGELKKAGFSLPYDSPTFNEFVVAFPDGFQATHQRLVDQGVLAGLSLAPYYPEFDGQYLFCATETKTKEDMDALVKELS